MIKAIEIEGFRSIRKLRFELKPLNVLIGPNQSGKTNILDALDLLANAVQGRLTTSLYRARGGLSELLWAGPGSGEIQYSVELAVGGDVVAYTLKFSDGHVGHAINTEVVESCSRDEKLYLLRAGGTSAFIQNEARSVGEDFQLTNEDLQEPVIRRFRDAKAYPTLEKIREAIGSTVIYSGFETKARWTCDSPNETPQIRQPQFVQLASALMPSGDNLVNVLYTLSQDEEKWTEFKEDVRIGFPDFENIVFPPDAGQGRISLAWVDRRFPRKRFPAEVLSAGTLSFLAMAALFSSPEPKGLIGIDEPEANLHPELLYRLVGLMEKASARRQLIVVTHSDALLSYLSDPTDIVLVSNGRQGTTLTRPEPNDLREWLKDYSLGGLRESGHLAAFAPEE